MKNRISYASLHKSTFYKATKAAQQTWEGSRCECKWIE